MPFKTVAEELNFLRKTFRDLVATYATQLEAEIAHLHATVESATEPVPARSNGT